MNESRELTRRRFLLLAAGLGGVVAAGPVLRGLWPVATHGSPLAAQLLDCFGDLESARAVGRAYLEIAPGEGRADGLLRAIEHDLGVSSDTAMPRAGLRDRLAQLVHRDFVGLEVVNVQGWILSRTECRLCALATLDADARQA